MLPFPLRRPFEFLGPEDESLMGLMLIPLATCLAPVGEQLDGDLDPTMYSSL